MLKFLKIFVAFLICANTLQAEPKLLGQAELSSLMNLTEDLGKLAEKVSPGSSAMLVLGATALAFNPEYKDFEVTAPMAFYLYSMPEGSKNSMEWVIAVKKKGGGLPSSIKIGGKKAFVKEFGEIAALCPSKKLLDSLSALPEKLPGKDKKIIEISLLPSKAMKECREEVFELRRKIVKKNSKKDKNGKVDLAQLKSLQIKLDYLEKLLAQIAELKIAVSFNEKASLLNIAISPEKGSALEFFIKDQKTPKGNLPPFYADKNATASTNLVLTKEFRKSAASFVEEMAIEQCEDEENLKYLDLIPVIAENTEGKSMFYMNMKKGTPCARLDLFADKASLEKINKSAAGIDNIKTKVKNLYKLSEYKIPEVGTGAVYCFITEKGASLASGKFTPEEAKALITQKDKTKAPAAKYKDCAMAFKEKEPTEVILKFKDGLALLDAAIGAETLRSYLPGQNQSVEPETENSGPPRRPKKKRIKINPRDFMR